MESGGVVVLIVCTSRHRHSQPQKCSLCCLLDPFASLCFPSSPSVPATYSRPQKCWYLLFLLDHFQPACLRGLASYSRSQNKSSIHVCFDYIPSGPISKLVLFSHHESWDFGGHMREEILRRCPPPTPLTMASLILERAIVISKPIYDFSNIQKKLCVFIVSWFQTI